MAQLRCWDMTSFMRETTALVLVHGLPPSALLQAALRALEGLPAAERAVAGPGLPPV